MNINNDDVESMSSSLSSLLLSDGESKSNNNECKDTEKSTNSVLQHVEETIREKSHFFADCEEREEGGVGGGGGGGTEGQGQGQGQEREDND